MKRFVRQVLVIARRDFTAVVFTPTFLIFVLAPLFMMLVATIGSLGAVRVVDGARERAVVLVKADDLSRLRETDRRLRRVVGAEPGAPPIDFAIAASDARAQARALLGKGDVAAVLFWPIGNATILRVGLGVYEAEYLGLLATTASATASAPVIEAVATPPSGAGARERNAAAFAAVFAMFFLTLLLAGQSISMLAEERNNKVIEILAAAVPLEAVFLGKLIGMLGVACLFTLFWAGVAAAAITAGVAGLSFASFTPAIGLPAFAGLFFGYFVLAFLLLSAVFLGVGAQASSPRELQMLSLPITIFQVGMFALASAGADNPDSVAGLASAVFPFSSPFAMAGRAASGVSAWQHLAAFLWQLLWVGITIMIAARLFRLGVLKSGGGSRS